MESECMIKLFPYNKCISCNGKLVVVQTETNIIELDKAGMAINTENIALDSKIRCINCGAVSDVNIKSMHYIEKSTVAPIIRKLKNPFSCDEE